MGIIGGGFALILVRILLVVLADGDDRNTPSSTKWGRGLLVVSAILAIGVLFMDTSVDTGYGRVNNIGLMKDQQNYLMVCGVLAVVGAILLIRRK